MKKFIKFGLWGMVLWPSLVFGFTMAEKPLKEAPTSSDSFLISDSQDSLKLKQVTTGSLPISTKTQAALDAKQTAIGNPCVAGYFMQGVSSTGVIQCATETDPVFRAWNKSYNDLTNKPALFSGAYSALTGKPELFSGVYSDLSGQPALFSGSYNDLLHKPVLQVLTETDVDNMVSNNGYLTFEADPLFLSWDKSYNDLTNKPTLFSGNYNDLTNKPTTITAGQASAITDNTAKITYPASASTKLAGIATGATANSTDALLRDRTTHTGTQAIATVTGLQAALGLKSDKAAIACATGFVLQGITINGTAECIASSSASLPTGTEGQVISYDVNGDPVASTVRELAFSDTDFNETVSGTTTTISLASAGGGTISLTESATDPAYSSMTTGQMIVSKSSGDLFYKSATGGYTFAGVYVVDPATYALTFTLSGVSGADKLTINGTDYTAGTTITGLSGDVAVTGTLGSSTALACTGTGISGSGLSYLASMTAARSMACVFSGVAGVVSFYGSPGTTESFEGSPYDTTSFTQVDTSDYITIDSTYAHTGANSVKFAGTSTTAWVSKLTADLGVVEDSYSLEFWVKTPAANNTYELKSFFIGSENGTTGVSTMAKLAWRGAGAQAQQLHLYPYDGGISDYTASGALSASTEYRIVLKVTRNVGTVCEIYTTAGTLVDTLTAVGYDKGTRYFIFTDNMNAFSIDDIKFSVVNP